jgi:prepilin-type N-terminal cleavage/methylation domain-containing protein
MTGANSTNKFQSKGFTLIEMLVSVAIFTMVVSMSVGVFVFSLKAQRKSLATQDLLDQTSYAVEYMSRALRMAQKDLIGDCIPVKTNYQIIRDDLGFAQEIAFKNYEGECQSFIWDIQLKEEKGDETNLLTSTNILVSWFDAELVGESQIDSAQPKITFAWEALGKENSKVIIQTTVSQRNADIRE